MDFRNARVWTGWTLGKAGVDKPLTLKSLFCLPSFGFLLTTGFRYLNWNWRNSFANIKKKMYCRPQQRDLLAARVWRSYRPDPGSRSDCPVAQLQTRTSNDNPDRRSRSRVPSTEKRHLSVGSEENASLCPIRWRIADPRHFDWAVARLSVPQFGCQASARQTRHLTARNGSSWNHLNHYLYSVQFCQRTVTHFTHKKFELKDIIWIGFPSWRGEVLFSFAATSHSSAKFSRGSLIFQT